MAFGDLIKSNKVNDVSTDTFTPDLGSNPASGNLLIAGFAAGASGSSIDTPPSGFTLLHSELSGSGAWVWYYKISVGNEQTVELIWDSAKSGGALYVEYEWDGSTPTPVTNFDDTFIGTNTQTIPSGAATPSSSNNILIAAHFSDSGESHFPSQAIDGAWIEDFLFFDGAENQADVKFSRLVDVTGSNEATHTNTGGDDQAFGAIAIFDAATAIEAALTGVEATPAVGSVTPSTTVDLSGVEAVTAVGNVGIEESGQVDLAGVESPTAVGSVTPSTTVDLSGVESITAVGDVAVVADVEEALTGVEATPAVGSVGVLHDQALSGVEATPEVGSVGFTKSGSVELSGVEAVSAVGNVGIEESGEVALAGVESPSAVGSVGVEHDQALAGVEATPQVGDVAPSTTVELTGVEAVTAVGDVAVVADVEVALTGVESPSAVDSVGVLHDQDLSGVEATPAVGSVTPSTTVDLSGVESVTAVGNVGAVVPGGAGLSGVESPSAVGSVGVLHDQALSGVESVTAVGSVVASVSVGAVLTGVEILPQVGSVTPSTTIELSGVEATTAVGDVGVPTGDVQVQLNGVESQTAVGCIGLIIRECISVDDIFDRVMENGETFAEQLLLIRANAAGSIEQDGAGSYKIKSADGLTDRIEGDPAPNDGRDVTATDVT
jgi:hypothetical protein